MKLLSLAHLCLVTLMACSMGNVAASQLAPTTSSSTQQEADTIRKIIQEARDQKDVEARLLAAKPEISLAGYLEWYKSDSENHEESVAATIKSQRDALPQETKNILEARAVFHKKLRDSAKQNNGSYNFDTIIQFIQHDSSLNSIVSREVLEIPDLEFSNATTVKRVKLNLGQVLFSKVYELLKSSRPAHGTITENFARTFPAKHPVAVWIRKQEAEEKRKEQEAKERAQLESQALKLVDQLSEPTATQQTLEEARKFNEENYYNLSCTISQKLNKAIQAKEKRVQRDASLMSLTIEAGTRPAKTINFVNTPDLVALIAHVTGKRKTEIEACLKPRSSNEQHNVLYIDETQYWALSALSEFDRPEEPTVDSLKKSLTEFMTAYCKKVSSANPRTAVYQSCLEALIATKNDVQQFSYDDWLKAFVLHSLEHDCLDYYRLSCDKLCINLQDQKLPLAEWTINNIQLSEAQKKALLNVERTAAKEREERALREILSEVQTQSQPQIQLNVSAPMSTSSQTSAQASTLVAQTPTSARNRISLSFGITKPKNANRLLWEPDRTESDRNASFRGRPDLTTLIAHTTEQEEATIKPYIYETFDYFHRSSEETRLQVKWYQYWALAIFGDLEKYDREETIDSLKTNLRTFEERYDKQATSANLRVSYQHCLEALVATKNKVQQQFSYDHWLKAFALHFLAKNDYTSLCGDKLFIDQQNEQLSLAQWIINNIQLSEAQKKALLNADNKAVQKREEQAREKGKREQPADSLSSLALANPHLNAEPSSFTGKCVRFIYQNRKVIGVLAGAAALYGGYRLYKYVNVNKLAQAVGIRA